MRLLRVISKCPQNPKTPRNEEIYSRFILLYFILSILEHVGYARIQLLEKVKFSVLAALSFKVHKVFLVDLVDLF